jgi:hypothetical protein
MLCKVRTMIECIMYKELFPQIEGKYSCEEPGHHAIRKCDTFHDCTVSNLHTVGEGGGRLTGPRDSPHVGIARR